MSKLQKLELAREGGGQIVKQRKWWKVCNIWCIDESSFKMHLKGQKHLSILHGFPGNREPQRKRPGGLRWQSLTGKNKKLLYIFAPHKHSQCMTFLVELRIIQKIVNFYGFIIVWQTTMKFNGLLEAMLSLKEATSFGNLILVGSKHKHILLIRVPAGQECHTCISA